MSLSHGPQTLAIPGPSIIPDRVLRAMHRPSPNIYIGPLVDLTHSLIPDLKTVARTEQNATIYIGNGHAAWEASLANTHARGDLVLVPRTGTFADGWAEVARGMGIRIEMLDFGNRDADGPGRHRPAPARGYRTTRSGRCSASTSTRRPRSGPTSRRSARRSTPRATPRSCRPTAWPRWAATRCEMDDWGVDVAFAGCQKGLMTPAGVAFVFYNDRAAKARERSDLATFYWDWRPRTNPEVYFRYFQGTGPTHHLYGLREALDMIVHEEGVENVWARHATARRRAARRLRAVGGSRDHRRGAGAQRARPGDPLQRGHRRAPARARHRPADVVRGSHGPDARASGSGMAPGRRPDGRRASSASATWATSRVTR